MSTDPSSERPAGRSGGAFETTHWSVVLAAVDEADAVRPQAALDALCRTYWQPLYAYVRRQGHGEADAQDLVQGFFARLLARRDLQSVRRERGRFRSYLLAALKHFLVNDWKYATAEKRGGAQAPVPFDDAILHAPASFGATETRSPDLEFDRQWALALLQRVLDQLRAEHAAEGKTAQFECLRASLTGDATTRPQSEIAAELGLSEGAVKQAVFRLRQRYQKLLRTEVAHTVATAADIDQELRHLVAALRG